jgi:phosphatidylglycerol:prolipoprotein diacylglycerol transferase
VFLTLYGFARFSVEFFREPDPQLGFVVAGMFTMGQVLSAIMVATGAAGAVFLLRKSRLPRSRLL